MTKMFTIFSSTLLFAASLANADLLGLRQSSASPGCTSAVNVNTSLFNETVKTAHPEPRRFVVSIPPNYSKTKPNPVILSFHGANRTPERQIGLDKLTDPSINKDHIVIYPAGVEFRDQDGELHTYWQGAPDAFTNDIQFTSDILDKIESEYCIDKSRIYATGKSQGGGLVGNQLACDAKLSTRISAFAPVSGAFYVDVNGDKCCKDDSCCQPATVAIPCHNARNNIPILEFHGGNDTTINFHGGPRSCECLPAIRHWVRAWAARDGLDDANPVQTPMQGATHGEYFRTYGTGKLEGLVTLVYAGDQVGHDWPSKSRNEDNEGNTASFDASPMIMNFFRKYTLTS